MEKTKFTFNVWLIAHALHPFCFAFYALLDGNRATPPSAFLTVTMIGILFSLPALAISLLSIRAVSYVPVHPALQMFFWLITVGSALVIGDAFIAFGIFQGYFFWDLIEMTVGGFIAAVIASLILYGRFKKAMAKPENTMLFFETE